MMIAAWSSPRALYAAWSNPRALYAAWSSPPIPYSKGVDGQLINGETGALLFDDITGAPLTW